MIGQEFESNNYGKVIVIGKGSKTYYYKVRFEDTGGVLEFRKDQIKEGSMYDKYAPAICGVACLGNVKTKGKNAKYYSLWSNMISRCYNPKNKRYNVYKNVEVCERWKCFEYFLEDIIKVEGWNQDKFNKGLIQLDKDVKQPFEENKIYSLETCKFISNELNAKHQHHQQNKFKAVSPNGEVLYDFNITDFARKYELDRKGISAVLNGRAKTHLGWKFEFLDN